MGVDTRLPLEIFVRTVLGLVTAGLLLLSGCGGDDQTVRAEPPSAGGAASAPAGGSGGDRTVLLASVGEPDDPEAFEIALTTEDGQDVEELPAGDYEIRVSDPSMIHNFALFGPGVREATGVSDREDAVFEVTFEPGDYSYVCEPHTGSMTGEFKVT